MPAVAPGAPALDDLMFNDLDRLWLGELNDLTSASKGTTVQALIAVRAAVECMAFTASGKLQSAGTIVLRVAFSAWLGVALGSVGVDEGRRVLGRVFEFFDAGEGGSELGLEQGILLAQQREVLSQALVFGLESRELLCCLHRVLCSTKVANGTLVSPQVLRRYLQTDLP